MTTLSERSISAASSKTGLPHWLAFGTAFLIIGLIVLTLFLAIMKINHGTFTYSLDDPYIHLELSNQIRHGNYGISAGRHAAPSSSILFPFLLAPAAGTSLHQYLPLVLNVLALFLTIDILRRFLLHLQLANDNTGTAMLAGAVVALAFCFNLIGLVFTGMEHSLHVATVAAIIYGLVLLLDTGKMPRWLPAVIVICPLLRYEGLPLSLAAILILAVRGHRRAAVIALVVMFALVAGFSGFLVMLGLSPMPSSILAKSPVVDGLSSNHALVGAVIQNLGDMYALRIGFLLIIAGVAAGARCLMEPPGKLANWTSSALMAMVLFCMVLAHGFAGHFGWFGRYEIYLVVGSAMIGSYLGREVVMRRALSMTGERRTVVVASSAFCLLLMTMPYVRTTFMTPAGAHNIFEQQFQMHRFVCDYYHAPVAVNDIGLVSYGNPNLVLDLGGLASRQARMLNNRPPDPAAYAALLQNNDVHLAIIYDQWFEHRIPAKWQNVASMGFLGKDVTSAYNEVQFYATDAATAARVRTELGNFQKTLPAGAKLSFH